MNHEAELFAFTFNITLNGQAAGLQIVSRRASAVVLSGKGFLKFFFAVCERQSDGYHPALNRVFDSNKSQVNVDLGS